MTTLPQVVQAVRKQDLADPVEVPATDSTRLFHVKQNYRQLLIAIETTSHGIGPPAHTIEEIDSWSPPLDSGTCSLSREHIAAARVTSVDLHTSHLLNASRLFARRISNSVNTHV